MNAAAILYNLGAVMVVLVMAGAIRMLLRKWKPVHDRIRWPKDPHP